MADDQWTLDKPTLESLVCGSAIAAAFLDHYVRTLREEPSTTVGTAYAAFAEKAFGNRDRPDPSCLLSYGAYLGSLYLEVVLPQQRLYDQIPETELALCLHQGWPLANLRCPHKDRNLRAVLRRIRNALTHGHLQLDTSADRVSFFDGRDGNMDFELTLTFAELSSLLFGFLTGWQAGAWDFSEARSKLDGG